MTRKLFALSATALCLLAATAQAAAVYSCTNRSGRTVYTQDASTGHCSKTGFSDGRSNANANNNAAPAANSADPSPAPAKAAQPTGNPQADLRTAQNKLQAAQQALEEGRKVRYGNERNYAKYLERISGLEKQVEAAQQAVKQLQQQSSGSFATPQ